MAEADTCTCGCAQSQTTGAVASTDTCACGCSASTASRAEEIAQLRRVVESAQQRLAELDAR